MQLNSLLKISLSEPDRKLQQFHKDQHYPWVCKNKEKDIYFCMSKYNQSAENFWQSLVPAHWNGIGMAMFQSSCIVTEYLKPGSRNIWERQILSQQTYGIVSKRYCQANFCQEQVKLELSGVVEGLHLPVSVFQNSCGTIYHTCSFDLVANP